MAGSAQATHPQAHGTPLVSVIIPVHDQGEFFSCSVESVLAQDLDDIEIILVDDGSSDGSQTMCDEFARRDSRVRVVHQTGAGAGAARNAGLDLMRGTWVTFVDADDWIGPSFLSEMLGAAMSQGVAIAMSRVRRFVGPAPTSEEDVDENASMSGHEACRQTYSTSEFIIDALWGKIYRSELFETLRIPVGMTREDAAIMHELLYPQERIALCRRCFYGYRTNPDGVTARPLGRESFDGLEALAMRAVYFEREGDDELVRDTRALMRSWNALYCGQALLLGREDAVPKKWHMGLGEVLAALGEVRWLKPARDTLMALVGKIQSGEL